jgi:murein DD-endopeptidase MepM/ murein hydrolase activator NlpD
MAGASTYHRGIDIGGKYAANIVASLAGTVDLVTYNASAGNYLRIDHGDGLKTVYMHCSKILVNEGDYVLQNTIIALVGQTGVATGPHLHFGIMVNGTYIDPYPFVERVRPTVD